MHPIGAAMFYVVPFTTNVKTIVYMGLRAILDVLLVVAFATPGEWRLSTIGQVECKRLDGLWRVSGAILSPLSPATKGTIRCLW
eukprot:5539326-Pleurochrysis_carterae.AAC.1